MNIKTLKNIMKEVNQPKEFTLTPVNLTHELYLDSRLKSLRKPDSRFDIFVWGGFISHNDFKFEQVGNDFHIKFIRTNFPSTILNPNDPNYGQPWSFENSDEVKIEGDLENVI